MDSQQIEVLLVAVCVSAGCALVGTFLVLRKVAMLGDAISHAVLPGIAIAFMLTKSRVGLPMVIGAGAFGVLTVFLIGVINRTRRLHEDASIGVVFPLLFSIGVVLITRYAGSVDLDLDCVLHGEIAYAPLDRTSLFGMSLPRSLIVAGGILLANILMVSLFFKELKLTSFDPQLAAALGFSPVLMHYLLMGVVSTSVVGSFEAVGAILVVAMLIVPPAAAYLMTDRLGLLLLLAVAIGTASSVVGYWISHRLDCSIAGAIASVAGVFFILSLVFSPRHGLLRRLFSRRALWRRFREHMVLLHLDTAHGVAQGELAERFGWPSGQVDRVLQRMQQRGWVELKNDTVCVTQSGVEARYDALTHPPG